MAGSGRRVGGELSAGGGVDGGHRDCTGGEAGSCGNRLAGGTGGVAAWGIALRGAPTYGALVQGQVLRSPAFRRARRV